MGTLFGRDNELTRTASKDAYIHHYSRLLTTILEMLAVQQHSLLVRDCLLRQTRSCLNKPPNTSQIRRYVLPNPFRRSAQSRPSGYSTSWSRPSPPSSNPRHPSK